MLELRQKLIKFFIHATENVPGNAHLLPHINLLPRQSAVYFLQKQIEVQIWKKNSEFKFPKYSIQGGQRNT